MDTSASTAGPAPARVPTPDPEAVAAQLAAGQEFLTQAAVRRQSVRLRLCPYLGGGGAERLRAVCQRLEAVHRHRHGDGPAPVGPTADVDWLHYGEVFARARAEAFRPPAGPPAYFVVDAASGAFRPVSASVSSSPRLADVGGRFMQVF